jgi:hypothetical protein
VHNFYGVAPQKKHYIKVEVSLLVGKRILNLLNMHERCSRISWKVLLFKGIRRVLPRALYTVCSAVQRATSNFHRSDRALRLDSSSYGGHGCDHFSSEGQDRIDRIGGNRYIQYIYYQRTIL